jgi:hypothetical protein
MNRIATTSNKRVGYLFADLSDGEESAVFALNITPGSVLGGGYKLSATADDDVRILAKPSDDLGAFIDIEANPIDLTAYPEGEPVEFLFKAVAAPTLTDIRRVVLEIQVTNAA